MRMGVPWVYPDEHGHWPAKEVVVTAAAPAGRPGTAEPSRIRIYRGASYFATRKAARPIAAEIASAAAAGVPVIADWSGIQAVTGAFMDEYVNLTAGLDVTSDGMNDDVLDTYVLVLARREDGGEEKQ